MKDYLKVTRLRQKHEDIVDQRPLVIIEQHINGEHDPKKHFRAEIAPGSLTYPSLERMIKRLSNKKHNPLVEADSPTHPLTLLNDDLFTGVYGND